MQNPPANGVKAPEISWILLRSKMPCSVGWSTARQHLGANPLGVKVSPSMEVDASERPANRSKRISIVCAILL